MARLQILYLPSKQLPDGSIEPQFALIVDQCTPQRPVRVVTGAAQTVEDIMAWQDVAAEHNASLPLAIEWEQERWRVFAEAIGACAVVFTAEQVDLPAHADSDEPTDGGTQAVHHYHFTEPKFDGAAMQAFVEQTEQRRRGDR